MTVKVINADCRAALRDMPDQSVNCIVTSPPYFGLRDYGNSAQIGLEQTPDAFVAELVGVFREARRVLRDDGTLWLNLGDSYASSGKIGGAGDGVGSDGYVRNNREGRGRSPTSGLSAKQLIGIPWRVAFALQADGWYLRQDIIWHKPNPMPESVTDRCTKSHEYIFLLSKSAKYYYDSEAVKEPYAREAEPPRDRSSEGYNESFTGGRWSAGTRDFYANGGRNRRDVWTIPTQPCKLAHFAVMPLALATPCILAGCPEGGICLDPFFGAGTTGLVAKKLGRHFVGIELNEAYIGMAQKRIAATPMRLDNWM